MNEPEMYLMVTGSADTVQKFAEESQGKDYQHVQEMRKAEVEGSFSSEDPTISDYILDDKDWIIKPTRGEGFSITLNESESIQEYRDFWYKHGDQLAGAAELTVGMMGTLVGGICVIIFAEVPVTIPFTVFMTYWSSQLAIDGWNRLTNIDIDGNAIPYP